MHMQQHGGAVQIMQEPLQTVLGVEAFHVRYTDHY